MKVWNTTSRVAVDTHRTMGFSCTRINTGECMLLTHPNQWVRDSGDRTVQSPLRNLREKQDVRAFLFEKFNARLFGHEDKNAVLWTMWDADAKQSIMGIGTLVAGPVEMGHGFQIPEYEVQLA